jgi:hypothetical protein
MHDPMVVAWEVPLFIPKRERWRDKHYNGRRWGFSRKRFTNPEHLGKPIYRWWRPAGWTFALAGRVIGWRRLATIWHVEPGGHDSGEVCRHLHRWQRDPSSSPPLVSPRPPLAAEHATQTRTGPTVRRRPWTVPAGPPRRDLGRDDHRLARTRRRMSDTYVRYLIGDARSRIAELPDGSVQSVITSPPYLAKRPTSPPTTRPRRWRSGRRVRPATSSARCSR